jgi:hypothetical protein
MAGLVGRESVFIKELMLNILRTFNLMRLIVRTKDEAKKCLKKSNEL